MLNLVKEGEEDYIEAIRYRRRLKIFENFLFSFCRSVVRTSGLALSATSGPLILHVLRKICESCSLISPNLNLQDHFLASI